MARFALRGVSKRYGATVALAQGDFDLQAGEVHVLIGSNGSGKSTLCKIVSGAVRPDAGEVLMNGAPVHIAGPRAARDLGITTFYQELSLAAHRSVAENICLADLPVRGGVFLDRKALARRASAMIAPFADVVGQGFAPDVPVQGLRADQRQLVEIMKTLAAPAPILIFDEPTSALDRAQVDCFFAVLRKLRDEGRSIVFISHRMDEIFAIGDRVTVIRDGRTVLTTPIARTDQGQVIGAMVGAQTVTPPPRSAPSSTATGPPRLSVRGLSGPGLRETSFDLRGGEILGLGGLHGQGQSALLRILFGASPRGGGEMRLAGQAHDGQSPRAAIAAGMAYVSGDRGRDGAITGRPILENTVPIHVLRRRLILARPGPLRARARAALAALNTRYGSLGDPISALSGGNQQKVVISRWLIERPDVLLLDDPTKGIDLATKTELFALIRDLAEAGMAIMLYSSEDAELLGNADRILVFNNGAVSRELVGEARTRFNLYAAAYEAA